MSPFVQFSKKVGQLSSDLVICLSFGPLVDGNSSFFPSGPGGQTFALSGEMMAVLGVDLFVLKPFAVGLAGGNKAQC